LHRSLGEAADLRHVSVTSSISSTLLTEFCAALESTEAPSYTLDDLRQQLVKNWEVATAIWPASMCGLTAFATTLARAVRGERGVVAALQRVRADELFLAAACLHGDATALAAFDDAVLPSLDPALRRVGLGAPEIDEVRQRLRVAFLVGNPGDKPKLLEYLGRGSLRAWLSVCAVRMVVRERVRNRQDPEDDVKLATRLAALRTAEHEYTKKAAQDAFSSALRKAIAALDARERTMLAQHYLDAMSLDAMATVYRSHRASVARWLAKARVNLLVATRAILKEQCAVDDAECDSYIRQARSHFEETLGRALRQ
jgi:RNA polymerase sigma-70 factor, ECF subfamily